MTFWLNGRTLYAIITSKARCAFEFFIHFNLSGLCPVSAVPKCRRSFLQQEQQPSAVGATHKTALMLSFAAPVVYVIAYLKGVGTMEHLITYENLRCFTYSNDKICKLPIKGIAVSFFGLGGAQMFDEDTEEGKCFAEKGIIYIMPYNNPWAWMNQQAVKYTDEIIDVLIKQYHLSNDIPIVSTGGSMGGQSALVYTALSKRTPVACVANCPVCDLVFHFTERPDLPRTLYSAFYHEDGSLEKALESASPIHMVERMPDVNYYIFHCECDKAVNKEKHSDVLINKMKNRFKVVYHIVPDRDHCDLTEDMRKRYNEYIYNSIL